MRRALLAIVILLATTSGASGQRFDRQTLLRVQLATEARQVATCQRLTIVSDTSPEDLRKKILRSGGDTGLVTFDPADPDKMTAVVYRCQAESITAPPAAPAPPSAVRTADTTSITSVLLGTWTGTLLLGPPTGVGGQPPKRFPATVRVSEEGGQLRFTMDGSSQDLNASGTVTHLYGDVTLTGTYGQPALPITYSLKLSGPTMEGNGVGADQILRTLSLRKQR